MFFSGKKAVLEKINDNISRKVLAHAGGMMAVEVHFKAPITDYGIHSHPHEQIAYVIKGKFEFKVNDEIFHLEQGDSIYFPPNVSHGCILHSDEGILLDTFTPQREDFLKKS
ncbi:MAG: cupin domain-containing protein [Defluviitaleaceae bacterium]|nr:cupin domain-containing protein [Defluviitaleaceae bacterium]